MSQFSQTGDATQMAREDTLPNSLTFNVFKYITTPQCFMDPFWNGMLSWNCQCILRAS